MRRHFCHHRRGFTIIEAGIIISLTAVLVSLGVMMFGSLLQAQRQTLQRDRLRREFMRLDLLLRRDVHAATTSVVTDAGEVQLKDEAGNRWNYRVTEAGLVREVFRNDEQKQRELFHWPRGTVAKLSSESAGDEKLLAIVINPPQTSGRAPARQPTYRARVLVGGLQPKTTAPEVAP